MRTFLKSSLVLLFYCCVIVPLQAELIAHGGQQIFKLYNKVSLTDLKPEPTSQDKASYTFSTQLTINSVWNRGDDQLLQIYLTESTVSAPTKQRKLFTQQITNIPDRPFYVSLIKGKPHKVIAHSSRDQSLLNLKRGIASLFQLQFENGPISELDVSGQCSAYYSIKSSTRIEKIKNDCSHWYLRVNYRAEKALGVAQQSQEIVKYELTADGALFKVESIETHRISLGAKPDVGSQLISEFLLEHVAVGTDIVEQLNFASLDEAIESLLDWYRVFDIEADVDGAISELKGTTLKKQITEHAKQLQTDDVGKSTLALSFAQLLPLARITKQEEFVEILQAHKDLHAQLVDLLGAVQTVEAHNAIMAEFEYEKNSNADLLEKYLQSLAVGTHPERAIIEQLTTLIRNTENPIKNEKLRDTVIQTIAALTRQSGFDVNDPLLKQVREYLVEQVHEQCSNDQACRTRYIRALQNLQDASTIGTLLTIATTADDPKVCVTALQALKSFPLVNFNDSHRQLFAQIFYQLQRKYDSSARTIALDILLSLKPTKQQLGELLDYLNSNDRHFELKTYVIQNLRMLAEKCPRFNALLTSCLAERPHINNYHVIAQKGLTTVLTRQLSQSPAFNESLLSIQEVYQGILKRGSVELLLNAGGVETSTFKLGIYTSGLSSFVGDSDSAEEDDADDSPASAGMEISVQGILLRPLIFFTGQTELMGHVWSSTASEPTPAYQATTLTHDHEHYVILASGATMFMRIVGASSIDLNGKVELSIWNRNAQTEIQQNSGAAIVGHITAGFTYAKVINDFTLTHEPQISLQADLDFYSGIKLCMQLQRPQLLLTHSNVNSVLLQNISKPFTRRITTKRTHKSPGRTLALNQKNNEMCNMIFA